MFIGSEKGFFHCSRTRGTRLSWWESGEEENQSRFDARACVGAFTLLEIMLAVIILGMMAVVIYRFVQTNVTAVRVSSETETVAARYDGLRELLTQQLQSLPSGTEPSPANR